jgi:Na+-transporting NADH:ubiquinone oxidoreductase subunit A
VITKGLDLPISGTPEPKIDESKAVRKVAIIASDYIGMRPTFKVAVGDKVKRGQVLFENKKLPGVLHTSFAKGEVKAINRGERRALQSVIIELEESDASGKPSASEQVQFAIIEAKQSIVCQMKRFEDYSLNLECGCLFGHARSEKIPA